MNFFFKIIILLSFFYCNSSTKIEFKYPSKPEDSAFVSGGFTLNPKYFSEWCLKNCESIQLLLKENKNLKLVLKGKHDATELKEEAKKFSIYRAENLKKELCNYGIECNRIIAKEEDQNKVFGNDKFDPANRRINLEFIEFN